MFDETYETPEGFKLPRPLLMPDARSFADVLTFVREWDFATMSATSGRVPRPELRPDPVEVDGHEVGPFCSVDLRQVGMRSSHLAVVATPATVAALHGRMIGEDHIGFKVIAHERTGRALIIAEHSAILGNHWLAYVDPATIPTPELPTVPEGTFAPSPPDDRGACRCTHEAEQHWLIEGAAGCEGAGCACLRYEPADA